VAAQLTRRLVTELALPALPACAYIWRDAVSVFAGRIAPGFQKEALNRSDPNRREVRAVVLHDDGRSRERFIEEECGPEATCQSERPQLAWTLEFFSRVGPNYEVLEEQQKRQ